MIISNQQIKGAVKLYNDTKVANKPVRQDKMPAGGKNDQVILSSQAQEFGQLLQAAKNMPEVRQERVDALAKQIAEGTYNVSGKMIAEKIFSWSAIDRI